MFRISRDSIEPFWKGRNSPDYKLVYFTKDRLSTEPSPPSTTSTCSPFSVRTMRREPSSMP